MINKMNTISSAMQGRVQRQEIISNNLANINSIGFKRDAVFEKVLNDASENTEGRMAAAVDFSQGALRETQNVMDAALQGPGFFTVQTPDGILYTRNGHFNISPDGDWILGQDQLVMGENGPINIAGKDVKISGSGEVFIDNVYKDTLQVVNFENPQQLIKYGHGFFMAKENAVAVEGSADIKQGFLEESNVNPIQEMVLLMTTLRYFEADQKALQSQDEVLRLAVNEVGRV